MAANTIPAVPFKLLDNQDIIPVQDFYNVNFADVLNGVIPGANTSLSSLSSLAGNITTQLPGSNLINTALNGVSSIGNVTSDLSSLASDATSAFGAVASTVGGVINDIGQLAETAINDVCDIANTAIDDATSLVDSAIGGVTGAVSSIFGDVINSLPILKSLSGNCLNNLFKGPLSLAGHSNLCGGLANQCGNGLLGQMVNQLTCNSTSDSSSYNSLSSSLQGNFLSNLSSNALNQLGVNNLMSGMSNCSSNPFSLGTMRNLAFNTLTGGSTSSQLLDFGNVGGDLANELPNIGSMVPNAISNFTNGFSGLTNAVYNSTSDGLSLISTGATAIQTAFDAISPSWDSSSSDGISSISNMIGSTAGNLANTTVYNSYSSSLAASTPPAVQMVDSSSYGAINQSMASNNYVNTTMGMRSGGYDVSSSINSLLSV